MTVRTSVGLVASTLLAAAGAATAQNDPWVQQAPHPTWFDLPGICMMSETEAWVVGSAGLTTYIGDVLHTTDGGVSWSKTVLSTTRFYAVHFLDANHGWIVGNDTYRTTDGGATWTHLNGNGTLLDVQFVDPLLGFACGNGGIVYRSTDGGATWIGTGISGGTHRSVFFLDAQNGWTTNIYGNIYHTADSGLSWTLQYANPDARNLGSIQFFNANDGWAIGGNHFLQTADGGATWTRQAVPAGTWAWDAWFGDRDHGIAVGDGGNVVRTSDAGETWQVVEPPSGRPDLRAVRMFGPSRGFFAGNAAMLYSTEDGGATWENRQSGGWAQTRTVFALDGDHAWAACDGGEVLRTTDGGRFWDRATPPGVDVYGTCFDVAFADASTGFAVIQNEFFGGNDEKVVRSLDGGATWQIRAYFPNAFILDTVVAPTPTLVLIAGVNIVNGANLLRSTDGGATWTDVSPAGSVWNLDFVSPQVGWLAGSAIMKTTDGGASWFTQHDDGFSYHDISFADESNGWAAAVGDHVAHTTDGGRSWTVQNIGTAAAVWGVSTVSPSECWVVLLEGTVRYTEDGGATWHEEVVIDEPFTDLMSIAFSGPGTGWVSGNRGIYHRGGCPPGCGETICPDQPDDFVKSLGGPVTGDALDLCASDDARLEVRQFAQVSPLLPFIRLEFWAHSTFGGGAISSVDYTVEGHVSALVAGGQNPDTLRTSIRNYNAGTWEQVDQRGTASNTDEIITHAQTTSAADYVSASDGEVRVKQDVWNPGLVFTPNWFLKVDLYEVVVSEGGLGGGTTVR